jgi:hypothetical protein
MENATGPTGGRISTFSSQHHGHLLRSGVYTLVLSADDGVLPTVYDAVEVTVGPRIDLRCVALDTNLFLSWTGGLPPYDVETALDTTMANWRSLLTTSATSTFLPAAGTMGLFRVRGQ